MTNKSREESLTVEEGLPKNIEAGAGALFSDDKAYRFALWRIWDIIQPPVMLIGLNPSTANEKTDDPTIRRIRGLAKENGFGGFFMTNLYPFVTPYPEILQREKEQLIANDCMLTRINSMCKCVVFCWGNFKTFGRDKKVIEMFPGAMCFGKNAGGSPKHPLYLKKDTILKPY